MSEKKVYVIGAGLAGMSAAFAALDQGANVVLVEKEATLGGNSAKATSGVNAVNTHYQLTHDPKIEDSVDLFLQDVLKSGKGLCDADLARSMAALSGEAVDELVDRFALTLSDINQLGGHSAPRTHRFPAKDGRVMPVGFTMAQTLRTKLETEERAQILKSTSLVDFTLKEIGEDRYIVDTLTLKGPEGNAETISDASAVVFTAGGYGADSSPTSLLAEVRPDLEGFPTTNGPFSTGDTVRMGLKKGLRAVDLEQVQLHPTGFVHPENPGAQQKFLCPEVIRGIGAVLLSQNGSRFTDEVATRDTVSDAIRKSCGDAAEWKMGKEASKAQKMSLMLMSQEVAEKFGMAAFNFYKSKGFIFDLKDEADVSKYAPTTTLTAIHEELVRYDAAAAGTIADPHGKKRFPVVFGPNPVLYGAYITPSLHFTMGGLAIKSDCRAVHDATGNGILNLFVAGENSGGVHGANRLGGNGCLESLVFGRLGGMRAGQVPGLIKEILNSNTPDSVVLSSKLDTASQQIQITLAAPSPAHFWPSEAENYKTLTCLLPQSNKITLPVAKIEPSVGEAALTASIGENSAQELLSSMQPGVRVILA